MAQSVATALSELKIPRNSALRDLVPGGRWDPHEWSLIVRKNGVISVIVPVYGVEKYLEECIESILNQTYPQLEVILVEDGSPDGCGAICDRYGRMDPRVIVIHQKNAGAAAARNAGLRVAAGEYIAFVDGDDFLEPTAYEAMVRAMQEHRADIVQTNFLYHYENGGYLHQREDQPEWFTAPQYLMHFPRDWTCALCWDKLFRHHVLTDVFFEEGHLVDDEFFTYQAVMNAQIIRFLPTLTYHYRQRASSVMQNPATVERKRQDAMEAYAQRMHRVSQRFPELRSDCQGSYVDLLLNMAHSDLITPNTVEEIKHRLRAFAADGNVPFRPGRPCIRLLRIRALVMTRTEFILNNRKLDNRLRRLLRIPVILITKPERILNYLKKEPMDREYKFFE